jgi:transcriptional regulator with GAF, ATPase, and Fis domain
MEKIKNVENTLSEQLKFERLVADIAARLAQVDPKQIDVVINFSLKHLGLFLSAERAFLTRFSEDGQSLKHTNYWTADGIDWPDLLYELDIAVEIPWLAQQILNGAIIKVGPGLSGLPEEARELREYLEDIGVNSGVVVPVRVEDQTIGMLGLDTVCKAREYPAQIIDRLKVLAAIIGSTIQRVGHQEKLQQYQYIVEFTTIVVGMVDQNYVYHYVNDAYCAAFNKTRQEIIGSTVAGLFGQEMFDQTLKPHYDRCFDGEKVTFQSWVDLPG